MKKLALRILGLTAIVLLSNLPLAQAAVGDCHITCCDGSTSWHGPVPAGTSCCLLLTSLCASGGGTAYQETRWGKLYCLGYGPCGV
jgi:hypothetical protein